VGAARELAAEAAQVPYRLVDHLHGVLTGRQGLRLESQGLAGVALRPGGEVPGKPIGGGVHGRDRGRGLHGTSSAGSSSAPGSHPSWRANRRIWAFTSSSSARSLPFHYPEVSGN
jgi:hypothetical protein